MVALRNRYRYFFFVIRRADHKHDGFALSIAIQCFSRTYQTLREIPSPRWISHAAPPESCLFTLEDQDSGFLLFSSPPKREPPGNRTLPGGGQIQSLIKLGTTPPSLRFSWAFLGSDVHLSTPPSQRVDTAAVEAGANEGLGGLGRCIDAEWRHEVLVSRFIIVEQPAAESQ